MVKIYSKMRNLNLKMNLNFLATVEVSDDCTRLPSNNVVELARNK